MYLLIAICTKSCRNGGTCSAPNSCICVSGWTGRSCEEGMDRFYIVRHIGWLVCASEHSYFGVCALMRALGWKESVSVFVHFLTISLSEVFPMHSTEWKNFTKKHKPWEPVRLTIYTINIITVNQWSNNQIRYLVFWGMKKDITVELVEAQDIEILCCYTCMGSISGYDLGHV